MFILSANRTFYFLIQEGLYANCLISSNTQLAVITTFSVGNYKDIKNT